MKRFCYLIMVVFCPLMEVMGQNIVNAGFENWVDSGNPAPFNWEEPEMWKSTNSQTEWTSAGVKKTTDSYSGMFACQLTSVSISGGWPSAICNGNPNLTGSSFSDPTIDIITGGMPIHSKPDKLTGYYKFYNDNVSDSGYAKVILKKYNTTLNRPDTVGLGDFSFGETLTFMPFEIIIDDIAPMVTPDSIVIAFYSTKPDNPQSLNPSGTGLIIDSLSLDLTTVSSKEHEFEISSGLMIYPNPVDDVLQIVFGNETDYSVFLYNTSGQTLKSYTAKGNITFDLSNIVSGMYYLKICHLETGHSSFKSIIVR